MSQREAIRLASRAIAVIQFITALLDLTYLPVRFMSLSHYTARPEMLLPSPSDSYYMSYDRLDIGLLFLRVALLFLLTWLFWNCGPWIERILLPDSAPQDQQTVN